MIAATEIVTAGAVTPTTTTKFHFSLWVADLEKTIAFYRVLFGQEPHKHYADYAKFEISEPPLVVSFLPQPTPRGAGLNHVGLRLPDSVGLVEVQRRLEQAGYSTLREEGVECCYALQTKFWVTDPDGVRWEVYTVHQDISHHGKSRPPVTVVPTQPAVMIATEGVWTHTLPDPLPESIPAADSSLDEVRLANTFNTPGGPQACVKLLTEALRVLRPGCRLVVRALAGDRLYPGTPDFPGLSAKYKFVPMPTDFLDTLTRVGFRGIEITSWKDVGCIQDASGVGFCIVQLTAWKTGANEVPAWTARYTGPFAQLTDDDGTVFQRGVEVVISADQAERIRNGPCGSAFTLAARQ